MALNTACADRYGLEKSRKVAAIYAYTHITAGIAEKHVECSVRPYTFPHYVTLFKETRPFKMNGLCTDP